MHLDQYRIKSRVTAIYPRESEWVPAMVAAIQFMASARELVLAKRRDYSLPPRAPAAAMWRAASDLGNALGCPETFSQYEPMTAYVPVALLSYATQIAEPTKKLCRDGVTEGRVAAIHRGVFQALRRLPVPLSTVLPTPPSPKQPQNIAPLLYPVLGFIGECEEWRADPDDPKEAGDVLWYAARLFDEWEIDAPLYEPVPVPPRSLARQSLILCRWRSRLLIGWKMASALLR